MTSASNVNVVPVSGFPEADTLTGDEIVPLVQDGESKRTTVADIAGIAALPFLQVTGTADVPILSPIADPALFIIRATQIAIQSGSAGVSIQDGNASLTSGGFGFEATDTEANINGLAYPPVDGTNGQAIVTNGAGTLTFQTVGRVNVPVLAASTRAITATDASKGIVQQNAASVTLTIVPDATENLGDGFVTTGACNNGGGSIVIALGVGVTLTDFNDGTTGTKTLTGVGIFTLWRLGANAWGIHGSQNLA